MAILFLMIKGVKQEVGLDLLQHLLVNNQLETVAELERKISYIEFIGRNSCN
jgi:hypothetical protein